MKTALPLLLASTALSLAIGLPSLASIAAQDPAAAIPAADDRPMRVQDRLGDARDAVEPLRLARNDTDDNTSDDDSSDRSDDDSDSSDDCRGADAACPPGQRSAAPAGSVAPPQNGLFGSGAAPVVRQN